MEFSLRTCDDCGNSYYEGILHFCPRCQDCGETKSSYHSCPNCEECGEKKGLFHLCKKCDDCGKIKSSYHICQKYFKYLTETKDEEESFEITPPTLKMDTIEKSREELSPFNGQINTSWELNMALQGYSSNKLSEPVRNAIDKYDLSSRPSYWGSNGYIPKKATAYY